MCIRDRLSPTPDPIAMIADPVDEPSANSSSHDYEPVSYTHLDVYKRQGA